VRRDVLEETDGPFSRWVAGGSWCPVVVALGVGFAAVSGGAGAAVREVSEGGVN